MKLATILATALLMLPSLALGNSHSLHTNFKAKLRAALWNAACTTGSPSQSSGCFGNVSSTAFDKINTAVGGFTTYANINPVNAPGSVFIKAFLAGTNIPVGTQYLSVTLSNSSAARCALFTQSGLGIGPMGISNMAPSNGSTSGSIPALTAPVVVAINNTSSTNEIGYVSNPASPLLIPRPIYLLCVGYDTTDGATATTLIDNISAS